MASRVRAAAAFAAGSALIGLALFACSKKDDGGGGGSTSPIGQNPEPMFRALQDDLVKSCGGPNGKCHVDGSYLNAPRWLGGPDPYVSIRKYRGILPATKDAGDSILLTQIRHEGPALKDAPNDLYRRVADWLLAEVPPPPLPNTGAFFVQDGYNNIHLDAVAEGLTGARLTFLATESNGVLTLSALRVVAPLDKNIQIDSPFFVILPRTGKVNADPDVNGFKGEMTVPAGQAVDMFDGKMILLRWDPSGQLKIVFQKIGSTPGQGTAPNCTALDAFKNSAVPAMRMTVDILQDDEDAGADAAPQGTVIGQGSCLGCHAQEPPPNEAPAKPVQAMDLRGVDMDPARACAQARIWIDFKDRSHSMILLNPMGQGNPVHPMKPVTADDPIIQGLKAWVDAEQGN